jgi:hypothetical protein
MRKTLASNGFSEEDPGLNWLVCAGLWPPVAFMTQTLVAFPRSIYSHLSQDLSARGSVLKFKNSERLCSLKRLDFGEL